MSKQRQVIFGNRIKQLREVKGISQENLANLVNINKSDMEHIERGARDVALLTIHQIADVLEIPIQGLFIHD